MTVREIQTVMNSKIIHDLLRTKYLAMFRLNKTLPERMPENKRREFIHDWQDHCQLHASTQDFMAQVLTHNAEVRAIRDSTECQAFVQSILSLATETASREVAAATAQIDSPGH
jgi:hypothetical protein